MKPILNTLAKILVSIGLIAYLAYSMDWPKLSQILTSTRLGFFIAAIGFFALSNLLGALQWHLLLRAQDLVLAFSQSVVFYLVGVFFNNVLLGNIGGDAVRIYDIKRLTGDSSGGIAATVMDRFIGLFSTCTLALAAYPLIAHIQGTQLVSALLPIWLGLVAIFSMGLSQRFGRFLDDYFLHLLPAGVGRLINNMRRSIVVYRHRPGLLLLVWAISLGVQSCRILVYWSAGLAVGLDVGLIYYICFQPVAAVIAALPISIGGLGVRENLLVELFNSLGIDPNLSFAMSLLGYISGIAASLLGGIAFILRRVERLGDEATP